ncbi:crotonase/enoyl-CoA hydratase family protein [Xenophilus arseniciresistens]|uniref:Crotonase/enoyl-CoA hydratase family protein n=1 Tax=Xenophilus arseniciresistens TaxID=1283306 RepID=A0AAE3NA51_9BURK|nr:crotonase/enoyl-CoA hydratase family protein [Xenophilus arseniciresistens]MDA7415964.1 crotonase/enoyl-CoA hydratase family protein [Xenophilus arseniciresistens]
MSEELLLRSTHGNVLVLTLNRPERRNAVNQGLAQALSQALAEFEQNSAWRVAVLTGAGGFFSAGMDLAAFTRGETPMIPGKGFGGLTEAPPAKPLIAAVEGFAVAGGCEMALACDLIVAAEDARFGLPEVKRGLIASAGGLMRLPQRLPYHLAMELALTGEMLDAPLAHQHGLVNRLTPKGGALDAALVLASQVAAQAPLAVAASKRVIRESADWPSDQMFARQEPIAQAIGRSADALEGARAFVEKRAPQWRGE